VYLSAEQPERKPRAELTEIAPNPPSFGKKNCPLVSLGRRPPALAAKIFTAGRGFYPRIWYFHLSLHAGALPLSAAGRSGSLSPSLSTVRVMGSHPSFHGHKATPRPAAPHPLAALAAASPHSYYRSPRPGLSISHRARRPLVPGAHACGSSPHMPRQWW